MKRHIAILIAVLLLLVPSVAAQEATTPEPPDGAPDEVIVVVDDDVALVDVSYENGETTLEFYSTTQKSITIAGEPESDERAGSFDMSTEAVGANTTTTVTVASAGGASFWTRESLADTGAKFVRKPSDSFISGPFTGRDVVIGAATAAIAVSSAVLYGAVLARLGETERGGRIA